VVGQVENAFRNLGRNVEWKSALRTRCMLEYYFEMRLRKKNFGGGFGKR
jgi:hypothetical protein